MKTVARKRFGQHFLTDRGVIAAIVDAIDPRRDDLLVEIGPGRAALTGALLERVDHLAAIEIDRDLVRWLAGRYPPARLTVIEADVLSVDFDSLAQAGRLRLVGNLPYNISSPLLVHLIGCRHVLRDGHFMLQKEVVERIVAQPGQSAFGRLTVLLQAYFDVQWLFDVAAQSFDPPPKVVSAVLRMRPGQRTRSPTVAALEVVTSRAFAQKRKMLRSAFLPWLESRAIDAQGIDPTARAEEVTVETYVRLACDYDRQAA